MISGVGYWNYVGQTIREITPRHVEFHIRSAGSGAAQTAEVAIGYSSGPPNKSAVTINKIVADGTLTALTGTGTGRNTTPFNGVVIPPGVYLWTGLRTAMATTQPAIVGVTLDNAQGYVLSTAAAGALTAAGPWVGAIIAASINVDGPQMRIVLDAT
jgi:hypothetical protein